MLYHEMKVKEVEQALNTSIKHGLSERSVENKTKKVRLE